MARLHRRWTLGTVRLSLLLAAAVGCFNLLIDPYQLFGVAAVPGLIDNKDATTDHARLYKKGLTRRLMPQSAIFGSSRAEVGLAPAHPGWDNRWQPAANLGLPGAGIEEVRRWLFAVHAREPLRQVVLGLDFFMFNVYKADGEEEFLPTGWPCLRDEVVFPLFSVDALRDSVRTLFHQDPVRYPAYRPDGQISHQFKTISVRQGGQRRTFQRVERHAFNAMYLLPPKREYRFVHPETGASTYSSFQDILALARRDGIDLRLFISPCHARMLEVISACGLWPQYEGWKRELTALVAAEAAVAGREPFPLWDFSSYNSVTTEAVPAAGDRRTMMRFYWEGSHFKSETGDLVLDRLFAWQEPGRLVPADFGVPLTERNIEAHLAEIRWRQAEYRRRHPEDLKELEAMRDEFPFLPRPGAVPER